MIYLFLTTDRNGWVLIARRKTLAQTLRKDVHFKELILVQHEILIMDKSLPIRYVIAAFDLRFAKIWDVNRIFQSALRWK